jgi:hypothetical protein
VIRCIDAIQAIWNIVDQVEARWRDNVLSFAQHRYSEDGDILEIADVDAKVMYCLDCEKFEACGENWRKCEFMRGKRR